MAFIQKFRMFSRSLKFAPNHIFDKCINKGLCRISSGKLISEYISDSKSTNDFSIVRSEIKPREIADISTDKSFEDNYYKELKRKLYNIPQDQTLMDMFHILINISKENIGNECFSENMTKSLEFVHFCKKLDEALPTLTHLDLKSLLDFEYLLLSPNSLLMQKIYHLILDNINDFAGFDALSLYCKLSGKYFKKVPKVKHIKSALIEYFCTNFKTDIKFCTDYNTLAMFSNESKVPIFVKQIILDHIAKNIKEKADDINLSCYSKMFGVFCHNECLDLFKPDFIKILKKKLEIEPRRAGLVRFQHMLYGYKNLFDKGYWPYDLEFLELLEKRAVMYDLMGHDTINIVKNLFKLAYYCRNLISHLESKFLSYTCKINDIHMVLNTAECLAMAYHFDFKNPNNQLMLIHKKLELVELPQNFSLKYRSYFCLHLAVSGYPNIENEIKKYFELLIEGFTFYQNRDFLDSYDSRRVILLNVFSVLNFKDFVKLPEEFLYGCLGTVESKPYVDTKMFEFFGGENYVLKHCISSYKHFIDYVVVVDSNNKPIDLSQYASVKFPEIEKIEVPPGHRMILYSNFSFKKPIFFTNDSEILGIAKFFYKLYENLGCEHVLLGTETPRISPNKVSIKNQIARSLKEGLSKHKECF